MKTVVDSRGINTVPGAPSLDVNGDLSILFNDKLVNVCDLLKDLQERIYRFNQGPSCGCLEQLNQLKKEVEELKNNSKAVESSEDVPVVVEDTKKSTAKSNKK
jgi:hypothetical protein